MHRLQRLKSWFFTSAAVDRLILWAARAWLYFAAGSIVGGLVMFLSRMIRECVRNADLRFFVVIMAAVSFALIATGASILVIATDRERRAADEND